MKPINWQDKNNKETQIFKVLIEKHINEIDANDFRGVILDAVSLYGAEGINVLKAGFADANIDLEPFNKAVAKIINQLLGFEKI